MRRDLLRPAGVPVLGAVVTSAFDKIGRVLSGDACKLLEQMRESIGVRAVGGKLQAPAAEHVALLERALLERRRLDMRYYRDRLGHPTQRLQELPVGGWQCRSGWQTRWNCVGGSWDMAQRPR
jgi:predicted DNA-binding transcriptional regulator YafY